LADYPCDLHLARYKGPSHRVYLNIYREEEEAKLKASVCADCLADLVSAFLARTLYQRPDGVWDPADEQTELASLWKPTGGPSGPLNGARRR
jgi:hypothetical protein